MRYSQQQPLLGVHGSCLCARYPEQARVKVRHPCTIISYTNMWLQYWISSFDRQKQGFLAPEEFCKRQPLSAKLQLTGHESSKA